MSTAVQLKQSHRFAGKVVIVTGASAGIGADAAVEFGKEGATLVIHGQNAERLEATAQSLRNVGVSKEKICKVFGPMEDDTTPERIVKAAVDTFGRIDVLINNAGSTGLLAKWPLNSIEICDHIYRVNFRSAALLTQLAMPHLIATKGNVVNVTSVCGQRPYPLDDIFYACMKAAFDHFTRCMASLHGDKGVRVNAVAPGPIETRTLAPERNAVLGPPELAAWAQRNTVLGRIGQPSETSTVLKFLASDDASYVTGAVWLVDGGTAVKSPPAY